MTGTAIIERNSLSLIDAVERAGGMFVNDNGEPVGLKLPPDLSFDQYEALFRMAWNAHELTRWVLGDLIVSAEEKYRDEVYQLAVTLTGLSWHTWENYASCARLVPPQRRRLNVGFEIHRAVQSLDGNQQRQLLARAEREDLTKDAVRGLVRELKGIEPEPIEREVCESCGRPL